MSLAITEKNIPQVCLLINNNAEAKDLALAFKQMGVHPFVISSLDEWWAENSKKNIPLTVADVLLTSAGNRFIADHPACQEGKSFLSFYYGPESAPLLQSITKIFHLGLIQKSPFYDYQLRPILLRANQFYVLTKKMDEKEFEIQNLENKIIKKVEEHHQIINTSVFSLKVKEWIDMIINFNNKFDFVNALAKWAEENSEVLQFGILEISDNGQKLISRQFSSAKYLAIPSLWPGNSCSLGMDFMAQSLATQVAVEMFGVEVIPLYVGNGVGTPKIGLFLKVEAKVAANISWKWFEDILGLIYSRENYRKLNLEKGINIDSEVSIKTKVISSFEFYSTLNKLFMSLEEEQTRWAHYLIDLNSLNKMIKEQKGPFSYRNFFSDLTERIDAICSCDVYITTIDTHYICLLLSKKVGNFSVEFELLKDLSLKFPYYKYFENPDSLLARTITIPFNALSLSLFALQLKTANQVMTEQSPSTVVVKSSMREINQ